MKDRKTTHRLRMFDVLKFLYSQPLSKYLGFKGGTALYFFYELPRFSVDLDIDLISGFDKKVFEKTIAKLKTFVISKGGKIRKDGTLDHSHRYIIQYGGSKKLKLEFTTYDYPNTYKPQDLFGLQVQTMEIEDMFAHKLCAFVSRYQTRGYLASRDLYDMHFLFGEKISPNEKIIKLRSKILTGEEMDTQQRYAYIVEFIHTHEDHLRAHILDGLGELVDDTSAKQKIKKKLLDELLEMLQVAGMR